MVVKPSGVSLNKAAFKVWRKADTDLFTHAYVDRDLFNDDVF